MRTGASLVCVIVMMAMTLVRAHDPITTRVTWNGDIARIVEARCVSCHSPDGQGPMSLATYEEARRWARAMKEEVMTRRMPKWHAARGYGDFRNDPSLSPFEIALVAAWADGGAPRGAEPPRPNALARSQPLRSVDNDSTLTTVTLPCGERPLPAGRLVAVHPHTESGQSVGIAVRMSDGHRAIVGWIRDFDPDFATTYWLRTPLALGPGATLTTEPREGCTVTVTLSPR
jgi:hypothetical protein